MDKIIKSPNDTRDYHHLTLKNNMKVLIIIDNEIDISGVSMAVNVGYYSDPIGYEGLAHFLEHMLFMGTKKYPKVDYFMNFLKKHGGHTNAYTSNNTTNYYYDVKSKYLPESLDIFSQFFINPLFKKDTVQKEIEAVNSEHSKNLQSMIWRFLRIMKELADKDHPYSKFGTGNRDTLMKDDIRDKLIEFYNKYYSSSDMSLVISTNVPFNDVLKMVTKMFNKISDKNKDNHKDIGLPFNFSKKDNIMCQKLVYTDSVDDNDRLYLVYEIPNIDKYFMFKPIEYINIMIDHKSRYSLSDILKSDDLCDSISFQIYDTDPYSYMIGIYVDLTDKGYNNITYVIDIINDYIDNIRNKPPLNYVFDDLKQINKILFNTLDKINSSDYVTEINADIFIYPIKYILYSQYYYKSFNYKLIKNIINKLSRDNCIIVVSSNKNTHLDQKEKWYNIRYSVIDQPKLTPNKINIKYSLPKKNIYIPVLNDIHTVEKDVHPVTMRKNYNIFHRYSSFNKDRVIIGCRFYNNYIYSSIKNYTSCVLYLNILADYIEDMQFYTSTASIRFNISIKGSSIELYINSFSNNIQNIFTTLIEKFFSVKLNNKLFNRNKEDLKKRLLSMRYEAPYTKVADYIKKATYSKYYDFNDILGTIDTITVDDIKLVPVNLQKNYADIFFYGNINNESINAILDSYPHIFSNLSAIEEPNIISMKKGDEEIYIKKNYNKNDKNSAVLIFFECATIKKGDPDWDIINNYVYLIEYIISERFFHQLRSIEQIGYIVKTYVGTLGNGRDPTLGIFFLVQSDKLSTNDIRERIKRFVHESYNIIVNMSKKEFNNYKEAITHKLSIKDNNMYEEFSRYYAEIINRTYLYNYKDILKTSLLTINISDITRFYKECLMDRKTRMVRIVEFVKQKN